MSAGTTAPPSADLVAGRRSRVRPTSTPQERRLAEAGAIGVMAIWAANFIVVKAAIADLPPIGFSFVRFLLAGVLLLALCRWREGGVALPRRDVLPLAALGAVGFGVYQVLWATALVNTTAGNSALIIAATPIFTMLIATAIGSDTVSWLKGVGALVSFLGVALVIGVASGSSPGERLVGDVMTLAAALSWAGYVSFGAPILRRHSPLRTTSWTVFFGSLCMAPLGLWQLAGTSSSAVTPIGVFAVLYSAVLAAGLGNVVVFHGIKLVGPTRITNYQFLVPAIAVILAALVLGETVRVEQLIGGAVIVLGILVARHDRVRPADRHRPTPVAAEPTDR